jgi:flavin reductase (DIM6/NTAB) family NADH-FMN oxidoreductase RutF
LPTRSFGGEDIAAMEDRYRVFFVNALSGFKAAHLVGTRNLEGMDNLAVFTSIVHIGANPPLLGLVSRPNTVPRDTLENIAATGEYTINHVNSDMLSAAHQTSARYPAEVSEFEATGLTPHHSERLAAPYVAESRLTIGLEHRQTIDIELNGTHLVIGEIVEVIVDSEAIAEDGWVDLASLDSVCAAGLDAYYAPQRLARFSYAKPDRPLRTLD